MGRPKVTLRVDENSFRAAMDRPEAKEALNQLGKLIVESFLDAFSAEDAVWISASLKTKKGQEAFRENWPKIVDAYFRALCNPKR
jgi:hypothetical protein